MTRACSWVLCLYVERACVLGTFRWLFSSVPKISAAASEVSILSQPAIPYPPQDNRGGDEIFSTFLGSVVAACRLKGLVLAAHADPLHGGHWSCFCTLGGIYRLRLRVSHPLSSFSGIPVLRSLFAWWLAATNMHLKFLIEYKAAGRLL